MSNSKVVFGAKIVYGPPGCGKTADAKRLRDYFGCSTVVDNWDPKSSLTRNALHLMQSTPDNLAVLLEEWVPHHGLTEAYSHVMHEMSQSMSEFGSSSKRLLGGFLPATVETTELAQLVTLLQQSIEVQREILKHTNLCALSLSRLAEQHHGFQAWVAESHG